MELWCNWLSLVNELRNAFTRERTFFWFVLILMGFVTKLDTLGVTSLARGVHLLPSCYTSMLHFFISDAVNLKHLTIIWVEKVFVFFKRSLIRVNGHIVIIGDGIKVGKEGKKMPAAKWLHQSSESNKKAKHIMGHSIQALAVMAGWHASFFAIPLVARIHEGVKFNCRDKKTLLDKMIEMLLTLNINESCYLLVDKYYCSGRFVKQLIAKNIHIVTMMKKNSVAYLSLLVHEISKKKRGRPKKYGEKVKLFNYFNQQLSYQSYTLKNKKNICIQYYVEKLFWRPAGTIVMFVFTKHPSKGFSVLMTTDLTMHATDLIELYSYRFRIECMFKQTIYTVGTFLYHFWLKMMAPRKRKSGDHMIHFANDTFKVGVARKIHAYNLFIQMGFIAHGLLQYISIIASPKKIWRYFGTWFRTIRPDMLPSEIVVSRAMTNTFLEYLIDGQYSVALRKFLKQKINFRQIKNMLPSSAKAA